MAKGDGWAVKRYNCPFCFRKGVYYTWTGSGYGFECMYKDCRSKGAEIPKDDVVARNEILKTESPKFKPSQK